MLPDVLFVYESHDLYKIVRYIDGIMTAFLLEVHS